MDNDLFIKKFRGRTEVVGKEGNLGLMNNLHMNIIGYKKKPKNSGRIKKKRTLDNDYSYVTSVVKEEFNKNIDFVPQLKNLSISMKLQNNDENKNNNLNISRIKSNERNGNNEIKNLRKINKSMENPIKLFKFNKNDEKEKYNKINNNNISIKLPMISSRKIESEKKYLNKNIKIIRNNSLEDKKNYNNNNGININDLLKQKSNKKISLRNNRNNNQEINSYSKDEYIDNKTKLPEYNKNKNISLSSRNILNRNNIKSNFEIEKAYNDKLNKLQSDLDYIKKQIKKNQQNNNLFNLNNNIGNDNKANNDYHYINNKNRRNQNHNKNSLKNSYKTNINNINNLKNSFNLNSINNNDNNAFENNKIINFNYYDKTNRLNNNYKKDEIFDSEQKEKRYFTSDKKQNLFGLNNKLNVIYEETEAKDNMNNYRQIDNKNFLEKIMEQRQFYQNKIPDDSIFKLNPYA